MSPQLLLRAARVECTSAVLQSQPWCKWRVTDAVCTVSGSSKASAVTMVVACIGAALLCCFSILVSLLVQKSLTKFRGLSRERKQKQKRVEKTRHVLSMFAVQIFPTCHEVCQGTWYLVWKCRSFVRSPHLTISLRGSCQPRTAAPVPSWAVPDMKFDQSLSEKLSADATHCEARFLLSGSVICRTLGMRTCCFAGTCS